MPDSAQKEVAVVAVPLRDREAVEVAPGHLDLHDVGAEVDEQRAGRGDGHVVGDLDHADPIERSGHGASPPVHEAERRV